jgi:hypothetical protein
MVIRAIAVAIGLPLGCALVAGLLYLANAFASRPWVLALIVAVVLGAISSGGAAYVFVVVYRRNQKLDALFTPLGLEGKAYLSFFRQYHGTVQERQVDVYFRRGPVLEVEVSTSLQTRLGVTGPHADTRFLAGLFGSQPMSVGDPAFDDLTVFALDEAWARSLLDNVHAAGLLRGLVTLLGSWTRQQVILSPGTLRWMLSGSTWLFGYDLTPEQVRRHLDDLMRLARIAERLPEPQLATDLTSAEQFARRLRKQNPYMALWIGLATLVGILVLGGGIAALILLLDRFGVL